MPRIPRIGRPRAPTSSAPTARPPDAERHENLSLPSAQDAAAHGTVPAEPTPADGPTATLDVASPVAVAPAPGEEPAGTGRSAAGDVAHRAAEVPVAVAAQAELPAGQDPAATDRAGFSERGRMRRRLRFLRRARELAFRDLGGLVFDMHRFGRRREDLVAAKVATLGRIDAELRALQTALGEQHPLTVLREPGIAACPRCAAIHGTDARFCPSCGLPLGRGYHRPMTVPGAPASADAGDEATPPPARGSPAAPGGPAHTPVSPHSDQASTTAFPRGAEPPGGPARQTP